MAACAACAFELQPGFLFCPRCGNRQPVPCTACGFPCPADFRFCPKCGTPQDTPGPVAPARPGPEPALAAPPAGHATEADRRLVTVLFADLSGFTALGERLDPEDVRALQADLFQEMTGAVEAYDGFVEKYVGDAVMAVFGAPVAHEDDPERALRAALSMHERVAALAKRWEGRLGQIITLHVGVNTGPVVAGNLGTAATAAYAVTGDTVNTAARLQGAAGPGETLVSRATHQLTRHVFAFDSAPDLVVKGKSEPLGVFRLAGALGAPRSARGLESHGLAAPPLVAREDEMAQLLAALDRMERGHTQVVSLVGDAGAGKSRLVREFLGVLSARSEAARPAIRQATCSSLGEQTYGVLAAFVRQGFGIGPDDGIDAARAKLAAGLAGLGRGGDDARAIEPVLGRVLGFEARLGEGGDAEPEEVQRRIFAVTRAILERRLDQGPLLLVVEDVQWADAASIEVLRVVLDRVVDRRLMLLVTHRPAFDASPLLGGRASHTGIRLAPLSPADSARILRAFFGPALDGWPAPLREAVVARAGGNPFYLEEIVRALIDSGVLVPEAGGWRCRPDASVVDVPPTIQALLLARLDRLPAPTRRLLQEAAVLGPVFDAGLLRHVSADPTRHEQDLEALVDAELLEEHAPAGTEASAVPGTRRYRFGHALVRDVVYQNLLQKRRAEIHGRAGRALERLGQGEPERLEDLESLGRHFSLSDDPPRGARYLMRAGDRARAIYANEDAIRNYRRALETLDQCGGCDEERLTARERLADVLGLIGAREEARGHYEAVLAELAVAGDRPGQARLCRKIGVLHWTGGDREQALAACQAGLAHLEGHEHHLERAHLYQEMGRMVFRAGDHRGAAVWAERALAHAEALAADPDWSARAPRATRLEVTTAVAHAGNTLGIALARAGQPEAAVSRIEYSAGVAEAEGLLEVACRSYANLAVLYSTLNPARAIETCQRGLDIAKKTGNIGFQSRLYANLALAYCSLTNRCDEHGIGAAREAIDLDRRLGQLDHLAVPLIVLAQIYQCHGRPQLALDHFKEAMELAEQAGDPQLLFPCYDGLAALHLEHGDDDAADEYIRKAEEVCARSGLDPESLMVLPFLE